MDNVLSLQNLEIEGPLEAEEAASWISFNCCDEA